MVVALVGAVGLVVPATAAHAAVSCEVAYRTTSWSTGFAASVQLKNLGDTWDAYTFQFEFRGDESITTAWPRGYVQSGKYVTFRSEEGARPVPTGGTVRLGFLARHTGATSVPANLRVNGVYCAVGGQPHMIIEPDVVDYGEPGAQTGFTMRLSQPPPQQLEMRMSRTGSGVWLTQPIWYYFNALNWNSPQTYYVQGAPDDGNTVDDQAVLTIWVDGYAADTVILQQHDKG